MQGELIHESAASLLSDRMEMHDWRCEPELSSYHHPNFHAETASFCVTEFVILVSLFPEASLTETTNKKMEVHQGAHTFWQTGMIAEITPIIL